MKYKQKLIRATDLRSVLDRLDKEEISFSYAATLLSDIAEKRLLLLDVIGSVCVHEYIPAVPASQFPYKYCSKCGKTEQTVR